MSFPSPRACDIPSHDKLLTSLQNQTWNGADLVANQKTVGYSHNCHAVVAQVHSVWQTDHCCNWKGPERPLSMSFLPLLACVVPSSTLNASQGGEGFLFCQVDFCVLQWKWVVSSADTILSSGYSGQPKAMIILCLRVLGCFWLPDQSVEGRYSCLALRLALNNHFGGPPMEDTSTLETTWKTLVLWTEVRVCLIHWII